MLDQGLAFCGAGCIPGQSHTGDFLIGHPSRKLQSHADVQLLAGAQVGQAVVAGLSGIKVVQHIDQLGAVFGADADAHPFTKGVG